MKWIGQNIYDQISKFRNTVDFSEDVTFYQPVNNANPNISLGSSDDERFRILINYKGTTTQEAQVITISSFTEGTGADDGRFQFKPDGSHVLDVDDGGIDFKTGFGISINGADIITDSSGTATLSNIDALDATTEATIESAIDTLANLTSVGTIGTGTWRGTAIELGSGGTGLVGATDGKIVIADGSGAPVLLDVGSSTAIETLGTIGTGVWNATAIASAKMATASASAQGAVELATTAEADTGTDTARAVTPEGLKSHVNARYARSTISFVGLATMLSSGNWVTTGGNGISNHTWNQDVGVNTKTNGTSAGSLAKQYGHMGVRVPYACVIENIYASIRNAGGNRQVTVGLFCARAADGTTAVDWGTTDATEPVLQIHADANNESGSYQNRPTHAEASGGVVMAAGDLFYPAMKLTGVTSGGNTDIVQASFTVGIKTLIA